MTVYLTNTCNYINKLFLKIYHVELYIGPKLSVRFIIYFVMAWVTLILLEL
jgi:hypothetical protein